MTASRDTKRPIVVKRPVAREEDHGGQWKVAYADFVTAMMAFFLIMWLLASATQSQREVIAKYFSNTSLFDLPAGSGVLSGGLSVLEGSDVKPERGAMVPKASAVRNNAKGSKTDATQTAEASNDRLERQRFEAVKAELEQMMAVGALAHVADNISVEMTQEGLRIQIFDRDGEPMFTTGSADPEPRLKLILGVIAQVLGTIQNGVIIAGHTDAQPLQTPDYTNWELSADRANAARRVLDADGLAGNRILLVEGRAGTEPLFPQAPLDARNRRISVTILRSEVEAKWRSRASSQDQTAQ